MERFITKPLLLFFVFLFYDKSLGLNSKKVNHRYIVSVSNFVHKKHSCDSTNFRISFFRNLH